jgi:hypothetical protein
MSSAEVKMSGAISPFTLLSELPWFLKVYVINCIKFGDRRTYLELGICSKLLAIFLNVITPQFRKFDGGKGSRDC